MRTAAAVLLLIISGCGVDRLTSVEEEFFVEQTRVELGRVFVGHPREVIIPVESRSRFELRLDADGAELRVPAAGRAELFVSVDAEAPGPIERRVVISGERRSVEVIITGDAAAVPVCAARNDCVRAFFDFEAETCAEAPLEEDTACGGASSCVVNGRCSAGECRGEAVSCDDGNACTDDACAVGQGCLHTDSSTRCDVAGPGSCRSGSCDPSIGCVTAEVDDGTACGPANCSTAQVCMSGACVERPVPEGSSCGGNSPCQGAGTCVQGSCVQPPANTLQPVWSYSAHQRISSSPVMDESGNLVFVECGTTGCELVSLTAASTLRFRVGLGDITVVRDVSVARGRIFVASAGSKVSIHSAMTGTRVATVDAYALVQTSLLPMSGAPTSTETTLTSMAADGAGRLYALVQVTSFSGDSGHDRGSFLLALDDATGTLLWKRRARHFARLVVNEAGRLFTMEYPVGSNSGRLLSLDANGAELFSVPASEAPIAAHGGHVLTSYGAVRSASTGSERQSQWSMTDEVLLQNDSLWSVPVWECFPSAPVLSRRVLVEPFVTYDTVLDSSPSAYVAGPTLLTHATSVLLMLQTSTNTTLKEVDPTGAIAFSCGLGSITHPTGAVLGTGRYFVVDVDYAAGQPYPTYLRAFDLPGRLPAVSGWVGPGGGPQHTSRPR